MVEDEHPEVGRIVQLLPDPGIALAPDLALGQVGLGRVDGDDLHRHPVEGKVQHAIAFLGDVARPERVSEMEVSDVLGVVVARDDEGLQLRFEDRLEEALGGAELTGVPLGREVAAHDDQVGMESDRLLYGVVEKIGVEVRRPAMQVGELGDHEGVASHRRRVYG